MFHIDCLKLQFAFFVFMLRGIQQSWGELLFLTHLNQEKPKLIMSVSDYQTLNISRVLRDSH